MDQPADVNAAVMRIVNHQLYELSKGIRPLSMLTTTEAGSAPVVTRLASKGVAHYVHKACPTKVNVIFGQPAAVAVVLRFLTGPLCKLSPEHDFMLGILLGYGREQQCVRYLERSAALAQAAAFTPEPGGVPVPSIWLEAAAEANPERLN